MSQLILSVACEMVFITIHVHCMFVGLFGVRLLSFSMTTVVDRGANFPAIFIHRGSGESGNRGVNKMAGTSGIRVLGVPRGIPSCGAGGSISKICLNFDGLC